MGNGITSQHRRYQEEINTNISLDEKEIMKELDIQSRQLRLKIVETIPFEFNKVTVLLLVSKYKFLSFLF